MCFFRAPSGLGLQVQLAFCTTSQSGQACDWDNPNEHSSALLSNKSLAPGFTGRIDVFRTLLFDTYSTSCTFNVTSGDDMFQWQRTSAHSFVLKRIVPSKDERSIFTVEVSCRFMSNCCVGPTPPIANSTAISQTVPSFSTAYSNTVQMWQHFWEDGAMVDIAGGTSLRNPQALELERRTIQSMYLLRAMEAGSVPPQESALIYNRYFY